MGVRGMNGLFSGIGEAFDRKLIAAENLAVDFSHEALRQFRARQMGHKHEPDGRAKPDTAKKKAAARAFAAAKSGGAPATSPGDPWTNRSFRAARTVYADAGASSEGGAYFNLYHTMSYGAYLELANNRQHAVLEPTVRGLAPEFMAGIKRIYGPG